MLFFLRNSLVQLKLKDDKQSETDIYLCKVLNKLSLSSLGKCCINYIDLRCNGQKLKIKNCTVYEDLKIFNQHCTKFY